MQNEEHIPHDIGRRIAHIRKLRGFTQEELASRARVSRSYLARVETDIQRGSLGLVPSVARALGVPSGCLIMDRSELPDDPLFENLCDLVDLIVMWKVQSDREENTHGN